MAKKILITGASGLIGKKMTELLLTKGDSVVHLGRTKKEGAVPSFVWRPDDGSIDASALQQVDAIVHLAGAGVADQRWTTSRKTEILESRTKSSRLLFETLKSKQHTVKSFV